ncbi:MAG: hypothetical protein ABII88_10655 [Candidatus Omnitrophota bacterium]
MKKMSKQKYIIYIVALIFVLNVSLAQAEEVFIQRDHLAPQVQIDSINFKDAYAQLSQKDADDARQAMWSSLRNVLNTHGLKWENFAKALMDIRSNLDVSFAQNRGKKTGKITKVENLARMRGLIDAYFGDESQYGMVHIEKNDERLAVIDAVWSDLKEQFRLLQEAGFAFEGTKAVARAFKRDWKTIGNEFGYIKNAVAVAYALKRGVRRIDSLDKLPGNENIDNLIQGFFDTNGTLGIKDAKAAEAFLNAVRGDMQAYMDELIARGSRFNGVERLLEGRNIDRTKIEAFKQEAREIIRDTFSQNRSLRELPEMDAIKPHMRKIATIGGQRENLGITDKTLGNDIIRAIWGDLLFYFNEMKAQGSEFSGALELASKVQGADLNAIRDQRNNLRAEISRQYHLDRTIEHVEDITAVSLVMEFLFGENMRGGIAKIGNPTTARAIQTALIHELQIFLHELSGDGVKIPAEQLFYEENKGPVAGNSLAALAESLRNRNVSPDQWNEMMSAFKCMQRNIDSDHPYPRAYERAQSPNLVDQWLKQFSPYYFPAITDSAALAELHQVLLTVFYDQHGNARDQHMALSLGSLARKQITKKEWLEPRKEPEPDGAYVIEDADLDSADWVNLIYSPNAHGIAGETVASLQTVLDGYNENIDIITREQWSEIAEAFAVMNGATQDGPHYPAEYNSQVVDDWYNSFIFVYTDRVNGRYARNFPDALKQLLIAAFYRDNGRARDKSEALTFTKAIGNMLTAESRYTRIRKKLLAERVPELDLDAYLNENPGDGPQQMFQEFGINRAAELVENAI